MSPIYEDEYLPLERNLSRKHRNKQGGQDEQPGNPTRERERERERRELEPTPL